MKVNKFFMGLIGALALTACSSDDPISNEVDNPVVTPDGDNFVTVAIQMPTASGSRADGDVAWDTDFGNDNKFNTGTEAESKVENIVFFFFNEAGNCIDIQMKDNPTFKKNPEPNTNPYVTSYGTVEVRLQSGFLKDYKSVAVAINSTYDDASDLQDEITSKEKLLSWQREYINQIRQKDDETDATKKKGSFQLMSNSVYYDMADAKTTPTSDKKVVFVPITAKNIYTSAQKANLDELITNKDIEILKIYVERAAARIDVAYPSFDMAKTYYVSKETDGTEKKTITIYDHANKTSKEVTVRPVLTGMRLTVLPKVGNLIKSLKLNEVGYKTNDKGWEAFQWNDPTNCRSYWESTSFPGKSQIEYFDWKTTTNKSTISQYVHPLTEAFEPKAENEKAQANMKVMVAAELHSYDEKGNDEGALPLVRYGADYMTPNNFLAHVANMVNIAVRDIDWSNVNNGEGKLADEALEAVQIAVSHTFATGLAGDKFKLEMQDPNNTSDGKKDHGEADWLAKVSPDNAADYGYTIADVEGNKNMTEALKTLAKKEIDTVIKNKLDEINNITLLYWNKGMTYYYANIKHCGFTNLVGDGDSNFLFGVVRNHIYRVNISGIFGLGTPVIEDDRPIDPSRPDDAFPSYIRADINILPWRVVTNSSVIH